MWLTPGALAQGTDFSGRIAYVTPRGQLAVLDPSGGEPLLLSRVGPRYRFPAFSPDGARIAAIAFDDSEGWIQIFAGRDSVTAYRSAAEPPIYLYWSPDPDLLSFIAADAAAGLGFFLAGPAAGTVGDGDPTGGDRTAASAIGAAWTSRTVATGSPFYWAWTAESEAVLIHAGGAGEGARLAFLDVGAHEMSANVDRPGYFQAPGISPSGRYIAYATEGPGGAREVVVASSPRAAGVVIRRSFAHHGMAMLSWSPVTDLLAVMAPSRPATHWLGPVQVLDAADGLLETVVEETALAFSWSPDGEKLAVLAPVAEPDVRQVADRRSFDPVVRSTPVQQGTIRLELRVAYVRGQLRGRTDTLATFTPSPIFVTQFLPFFDQYALSHRIWSPGSDGLVLPMVGIDGVTRVVHVTLGGDQHELAHGDMPSWNVR